MRTSSPTAGSAHAFAHLVQSHCNAMVSCFYLYAGCNPANPFVARKRGNIHPEIFYLCVGLNGFAQVRRQSVYGATGKHCFSHNHLASLRPVLKILLDIFHLLSPSLHMHFVGLAAAVPRYFVKVRFSHREQSALRNFFQPEFNQRRRFL